jgi:phenylpyruvate tautomerase PptA (4-oxalocrotonate tautomerase family)
MTIAFVKIPKGRSLLEKQKLIENVSRALTGSLGLPADQVNVLLNEYAEDLLGHQPGATASVERAQVLHSDASVAEATAKLLAN